MHFEFVQIGAKHSALISSDGITKLHTDKIMAANETGCQTHQIDIMCALAHFSMHFGSIQVSVKHSTTTGFQKYYKFRANKIDAQNETKRRTPQTDFICALIHFGLHFESVRVGVKLFAETGSTGTAYSCG